MVIEIRRARSGDLEALLPLVRAFCTADGHPNDESRITRGLRPLLVDDSLGQVWLAEDEGVPVGYAVVTWGWSLEAGGREGLLDEIFVRVQGKGWGTSLLAHATERARAAGCTTMFLETEAHNSRARGFYARHGFAQEDSVWMSAKLPEA
ncbi:GNAT family N-acetyltransferase [Streptomyces sp. NPDC048337]|uniref:GNAT family N-acetyltransferase n=1 Tax=Streptomyces sp. NPDC048337 TaxID=3365535 RepID=UPI00371DDA14